MESSDSQVRNDTTRVTAEDISDNGLLQTKLFRPPLRPNAIARPRLTKRLSAASLARLVLISAPAGFGKTTLVAEWLTARDGDGPPCPAAWLLLEEGDNEPGRFWRYVIAALQTINRRIGGPLKATLGQRVLPPVETWLPVLLNDLAAADCRIILVLDDYHVIRADAIHQTLNYFIHHAPPSVQLVLIGRADPPLPLARLRVQDELVELRAADLRFTPDEIERYLNISMTLGLSAKDLELLEKRTEGWPAGVQLAARSLQGYDEAGRLEFIRSFSGSNRYVLNYLLEEVLQQQTPDVREFLLRTSILARLTAPVCAAVMDQPEATVAHALAQLADEHLFTIPLDPSGRWYRYHALFSESLETSLRESDPALWSELHRRASQWCVQNGYAERAIDHVLVVGDFATAVALIAAVGDKTWTTGEIGTLLRWLDALPRPLLAEHLPVRLLYAWGLFLHDRWDEATKLWEETGAQLDRLSEPDQRPHRGQWAAIGAAMAAHRQEPEQTIRLAQQALGLLPVEDRTWRAVSHIDLGLAYLAQGNPAQAAGIFRSAAELSLMQQNVYLAFAALGHLGDACLVQGRLHESQAAWERLQQLEEMPGGRELALRANGDIGLGLLASERGDLLTAERLLREGLERIWPGGQPRVVIWGRMALSAVYAARGDHTAAQRQLDQAAALVRHLGLPAEGRVVEAHLARLALRDGRIGDVAYWQEHAGITADDPPDYRLEMEHRVLAEVLIANGQYDAAEALVSRLRVAAESLRRHGSTIPLLLLQALALAGKKRLPEAEAALRRAVFLAEPQGYIRTFVDQGAPLLELLRRPGVRQQSPHYVNQLLRAFNDRADSSTLLVTDEDEVGLLEELTPREREILSLIARGASNQEIADRLVLSVGTVKGHVNHIFSKLGVHNRTAAVAHARELGLIAP